MMSSQLTETMKVLFIDFEFSIRHFPPLLVLNARHRPSPVLESILIGTDVIYPSKSAKNLGDDVLSRGGGALPSNRLMGMCRWMGSHFHDWIEYNGVIFSTELLEWGRIFSEFGG